MRTKFTKITLIKWTALEKAVGGSSAVGSLSVLNCGHRYINGDFFGNNSIAN
ncbi:MAG: hypothetical protein LBH25_11135 [Fibromonadaceae bacterium]|jgi:hypothetical protein|nr:hypothetical protein [Fibromonadaceae bacterium]